MVGGDQMVDIVFVFVVGIGGCGVVVSVFGGFGDMGDDG